MKSSKNYKKRSITILMFIIVTLTVAVFSQNIFGKEVKEELKLVDKEELNKTKKSKYKLNQLRKFIKKDDNALVFYGTQIDKKYIYKNLLNSETPMLSSEVNSKEENLKGVVVKPTNVIEDTEKENSQIITEKMKSIPIRFSIINQDGEIMVEEEEITIPEDTNFNTVINDKILKKETSKDDWKKKIQETKKQIKKKRIKYKKKNVLEKLFNSNNNLMSGKVWSNGATFLDSIRKTNTYYGKYYRSGKYITSVAVGKHITDYFIYDCRDNNKSYDHIAVIADVEGYPGGRVETRKQYKTVPLLGGFQGSFDNYYSSDKLVKYEPTSNGLTIKSNAKKSFSIGLPFSVGFSYLWSGNKATMKGVGNKSTGYYYNYWNGKGSYGILATKSFTTVYSALYKSKGTYLKLNIKNSFQNQMVTDSKWKWYGKWDTLVYDY